MTSMYRYESPSQRPRCWGDARIYDQTSRECRNCPFVSSCSDQITRARNATQLAQATVQVPQQPQVPNYGQSYFAQYAPPQVANPLPIMQPQQFPQPVAPQAPQPVPVRPVQVAPVQVPVQTPQAQMMQRMAYPPLPVAPQSDRYGWMNDPLYFTIAATPPIAGVPC